MRVCLDRIKVKDRHDPQDINNYSEACQTRCRRMPEKLRYKCLVRCKRSEKSSNKSRRSNRSVWWSLLFYLSANNFYKHECT
jgi:hypothetical protein